MSDPFDPNTWVSEDHEYRIYGDNNAQTWAVVDEEDYQWAVQWCWHVNKNSPKRTGKKQYMRRCPGHGRKATYLHKEILKRTRKQPPSDRHIWVDHKDGNEFNCRRSNLRWVTPKQNRRKHGNSRVSRSTPKSKLGGLTPP